MLQDMPSGRLENEFRNITPTAKDPIICFHERQVLLCRGADNSLTLPTLEQISLGGPSALSFPAAAAQLFLVDR